MQDISYQSIIPILKLDLFYSAMNKNTDIQSKAAQSIIDFKLFDLYGRILIGRSINSTDNISVHRLSKAI